MDTATEKQTVSGSEAPKAAPAKRTYSAEFLAEQKRIIAHVLDEGEKRVRRSCEKLVAMGIIDKDGNRLRKDLPPDMVPGSDRDFGG